MASTEPLRPGDPAPDFTLRAVDGEGTVSLADYRGRAPVLLAFERGLWCAFCRRHLARLSALREKLASVGVETLAILATEPERARLYLQFHPIPLTLAAAPGIALQQSYRLYN